jgi:uncharacterized protein (UPF0332 family)
MRAEDFLDLASELAVADSEAAWRTAISRSYYAAFHVARDFLNNLGFDVPHSERAHVFIRSRLDASGQIDIEQAAEDLRELRRYRNQADYDLGRRLGQSSASAQVIAADKIMQTLNAALEEPFRSRITEAIRRHEREVLKEVTWRSR